MTVEIRARARAGVAEKVTSVTSVANAAATVNSASSTASNIPT